MKEIIHVNDVFKAKGREVGRVARWIVLATHEAREVNGRLTLRPVRRFRIFLKGHKAAQAIKPGEGDYDIATADKVLPVKVESVGTSGYAYAGDAETDVTLTVTGLPASEMNEPTTAPFDIPKTEG